MSTQPEPIDFLREKVRDDRAAGRFGGRVQTVPPEPNGSCTSDTPSPST